MKTLENIKLVKFGMKFCEEKILPFVIAYAEPKDFTISPLPLFGEKKSKKPSKPSKPDVLITYKKAQEIAGTYQVIFISIIYAGFIFVLLTNYIVSLFFTALRNLVAIQEQIELGTSLILIIIIAMFWVGVTISVKKQMMIWEEFEEEEYEIQELERYSSMFGSKKIEKILKSITDTKIAYKEEVERLKLIKQKRSIQDIETMKMFNAMMNEREKEMKEREEEIKRKSNIKTMFLSLVSGFLGWFLGSSMTYALEKTYDYWFFGIKPNFGGLNKQ